MSYKHNIPTRRGFGLWGTVRGLTGNAKEIKKKGKHRKKIVNLL